MYNEWQGYNERKAKKEKLREDNVSKGKLV
jgi:hypothetical protein